MIKTVKRLLQKPHNKTNKTSYVLSLLEQGHAVSQYMLYKRHFYYGDPLPTRLSSVIFRLKRKEKPIKDRWVNINGVQFKQYYLDFASLNDIKYKGDLDCTYKKGFECTFKI